MSLEQWEIVLSWATLVESIVVSVSVVFIGFQVRQFRQESSTHKVEGIKWLSSYLSGNNLKQRATDFKFYDKKYPDQPGAHLILLKSLLSDYDFIAELVSIQFLVKKYVLNFLGSDMFEIMKKLNSIEDNKDYKDTISTLRERFPAGIKLIKDGYNFTKKKIQG